MSEQRHTFPWFKFFYRDFLAATMGWSPAERGAYLVLICAQWESGPIDNDIGTLAAICGTDVQEMTQLWVRIGRKFHKTPDGLVNERADKVREDALQTLTNRQGGAAKSRAKKRPSNVIPIGGANGR